MSCAGLQGVAKKAAGLLVLVLLPVCGGQALAAGAADPEATRMARERAAIVAERDRLEARFAAELAACAERFAVTACQDDVRERRRSALEGPRARELALDDAERRSRAAARRDAVGEKQRRVAERPPPAVITVPAPAASNAATSPVPARSEATAASRAAASAAAETAAAQRAAAARQRHVAIKAEQARIEARQEERARRGKSGTPLPLPASAPPSRARPPVAPGSAARW